MRPHLKPAGMFTVVILSICIMSVFTGLSFADDRKNKEYPEQNDSLIKFNFVDVEIPAVIRFISKITGYNFIFDERIRGKITIIAPTRLSVDDSFSLFTSVLSLKGYTVIPAGAMTYKIVPSAMAKQEGIVPTDKKVPVNESYITRLISTKHIRVEDALQFLRPIVSRDGHISAFDPQNLLLVVDSAVNIEKITSILETIDQPYLEEEPAAVNVYFLEHADANDLAQVLQGILKGLQTSYQQSVRRTKQGAIQQAAPVLSITPDKSTNSLIIVAPPSDYKHIVEVIETLDKKRKQVYVEAMIVEASIDKLQDLGTKWRAIAKHEEEPVVIGGFGNISSSAILDIISGLTGFSVGGMGNFLDIPVTTIGSDGSAVTQNLTSPGFAALFSLNEFKDAINVLSTPQILTSDNEEAEILVGENVPFIAQRERDVTTTNTVLNSIERTDVGIKLRITPQITEGDYVKLDIFQEISSVKDTSEDILITVGPTTTKRATKTSVVVKDGHTVVIGGLMQEREEEGTTKTPVLGDIPVLGWLFKFKSITRNKTNLLVFLSPHVVKESTQLAELTDSKREKFVKDEKFYNKGELLVKFKPDVSKDRILEIISEKDASIISYFKQIDVYHIRLKIKHDVEDAIKEFSALPEVLYAEPNYRLKIKRQESTPRPENYDRQNKPEIDSGQSSNATEQRKPSLILKSDKKKTVPTADTAVLNTPYDYNLRKIKARIKATMSQKEEKRRHNYSYVVQVGAWKNPVYAEEAMERLKTYYPECYIVKENRFHKLRIPGDMTEKQARIIIRDLENNFDEKPFLVKIRE